MDIKYRMRKMPEYKAQAKQVIKVLDKLPHLLVRIEVSGEHFPYRAPEAFVMIKVDGKYFKALFTEISSDNTKLIGYMPIDVPSKGTIVFGYGNEIWGTVPGEFDTKKVIKLDKEKLPKDIVHVDEKYFQRKKLQRFVNIES